ncbi:hypothetical protein K3495_g8853 [Podosphaera aphanis]|nr:hypothetical protein K3495_g8853 [Podosphaera aphanis]
MSLQQVLDPHVYTSGRWLCEDELERKSRYIAFDFDLLCERVIKLCTGAVAIAKYHKREGGFNRVFIFTTDNAKCVVARLPFAHAGPSTLRTNSEVATIKYLQSNTNIPIPKIIDWNDDPLNPIGSEYIIMEHCTGTLLHQRWPTMDIRQQIKCMEAIYQIVKEMASIKFPVYGSLYCDSSSLGPMSRYKAKQGLFIGPNCSNIYWDCNIREPRYYYYVRPNQGPWQNLSAYCDGLIDTGISRIPPSDSLQPKRARYHGTAREHLNLLESGRVVLKKMSEDPRIKDAATPTLFHPDLHKRNIFVSDDDPTVITAIIDWQATSIEPAFWYAGEIPDFARTTSHSPHENQFGSKKEIFAKAFNDCTQLLVPTLAGPRLMDQTLFNPFRFSYRTWNDGAVAFRNELIRTTQHWKELGLPGSCPLPLPTSEELAAHQRKYRMFEAAHQYKNFLIDLLCTTPDGWAHPDDWERIKKAHKEAFDKILQNVLSKEDFDADEPIKNEEDLREIWPFDLQQK